MTTQNPFFGLPSLFISAVAVLAAVALSSCGSLSKRTISSLTIEAVPAVSGHVLTFHALESAERIYIYGLANEHSAGVHLDIQLLDSAGQMIAEKQESLDPTHPAVGGGRRPRDSYIASFPLSEARRASRIRIICHNKAHTNP